jgi:hypothetical protein
MAQKELITKKDYAAIGEEISHQMGNDMMKAYETAYPGAPTGFMIGRNIIEKILAQPGCVGLHFRHALNAEGKKTFVYIGIDANGNEILQHTMVSQNGVIVSEDAIMADWIFWPGFAR